jgi:hypothetical protein
MPIESLLHLEYTSKSDVFVLTCLFRNVYFSWSFGVTLWEIYSFAEVPYSVVQPTDLIDHLRMGKRLDKPKHASDEL